MDVVAAAALGLKFGFERADARLNVRLSAGKDGENAWPKRTELFFATIAAYGPDLIGFQEVLADQHDAITARLTDYGFSGGAKCILPGVSSLRTIMRNHSFTTTTEFNMGNPHTLMRSDAEQAARMMGLDFKIDAILNGHAQICNLFAGDFEAEIQHAAAYAAEHYAAKFVPDCDVVIANNYFKPAEANCAYTPEVIASLKDGGSFVLAANSPFGPCVHFLYDKWGHSAPGGMMWSGCYTKGKNMAHAVVFAEHTVKGMRDPWYIDEHSGAEYVKTWSDALRILDDGTPKKVVLYPNAECQVLDNSKQFYKQGK